MIKSQIRVLIVDDDQGICKALTEIIQNLGFRPIACLTPNDALKQLRVEGAQLAIIDCLLPKMSGIELAKVIQAEFGHLMPVILTSGVYRDRSFMKDALQQTGAIQFVSKPFQLLEIQDVVNKALEGKFEVDALPLEAMLTTQPSPAEKVREINSIGEVQAFDIPWLCCLLMNSSLTGLLRFENETEKSSIHFLYGRIVQVDMKNPESFFGQLLVEKGYLSSAQIETALALKSPKKLGERLVDLNFLSPHVITQTNSEQTAIRLSKLISDQMYNVNFSEEPVSDTGAGIDTETIAPFLIDWLNSKLQHSWLKQRYLKWLNSPPMRSQGTQAYLRLWSTPPLKNVPDLVSELSRGVTLNQVLAKGQYKEEVTFQVFHLLIIIGFIQLKKEFRPGDEAAQLARLRKILQDIRTQDYFEILGLNRTVKSADIKKTYYELAKAFHPDKVPSNATNKLKELAQEVFSQMTRAYETLSDDSRRATYLKEIEMGRAEKILRAEGLLEDGKQLLRGSQAAKAKDKFEEALALRPPNSELLVHMAWAKLLVGDPNNLEDRLTEIEATLNKIPPEDRHNAIYYFVKALYQRATEDEVSARKNLQHALALNPKFIDAERLLRALDHQQTKKKASGDIFRGDLKDVVGNLFRKK